MDGYDSEIGEVRSADSPCRKGAERCGIQQMPLEILLNICCLLSEHDLASFACLCKSFHTISKDPFCVAAYFLRNHHPHSIYHAICFPRTFTVEVFEHLIKAGALLSRNLVQELGRSRFGESSGSQDRSYLNHSRTSSSWGSTIPFESCMAVLKKGGEQYGNDIQFTQAQSDENVLQNYSTLGLQLAWTSGAPMMVCDMFGKGRYLPLPDNRGNGSMTAISNAVARWPELVPLALKNGWTLSTEEGRTAVRQVLLGETESTDRKFSAKILDKLGQLCKHSEHFGISVKLASEVINSTLDETYRWSSTRLLTDASSFRNQAYVPHGYESLLRLYRAGQLSFELSSVVEATMEKVWQRGWRSGSFKVLQKIAFDFPGLGETMATPLLQSLCHYVREFGKPSADVDVMRELDCVYVTEATISNTLLAKTITDATFIFEIAEAKLGSHFDWQVLVRDLLPELLCQPFRSGKILTSLNAELPNFAAMLEDVLMVQDFRIPELPKPSAYPHLCSHLFRLGKCDLPRSKNHTSGDKAGVHSIVSFESCGLRSAYSYSYSRRQQVEHVYDGYFFNFWKLNGRVPPGSADKDPSKLESVVRISETGTPLFDLAPIGDPGIEDGMKELTAQFSKISYPSHQGEWGVRFDVEQTAYGLPYTIRNMLSLDCIGILGPASPASSLILSHSLINSHSRDDYLLESLVTEMMPYSFDLGHWKLLAWLGKAPPRVMVECIAFGAPFSLDGSLEEEPEQDTYVTSAERQATNREKAMALECAELSECTDSNDVTPRFNASRDRRKQGADLAKVSTEAMNWNAPFMGSKFQTPSTLKSDDCIEVYVGFHNIRIFLNEKECRRRVQSIALWIAHIEGLLNLARKLFTLEKYVARKLKHPLDVIVKTDFVKTLERRASSSSLRVLNQTRDDLERAIATFEERALARRVDAEGHAAEIEMELEDLKKDSTASGEALPSDPYSRPPKRGCVREIKTRRKSKRARRAADDKYEDNADDDFDPASPGVNNDDEMDDAELCEDDKEGESSDAD